MLSFRLNLKSCKSSYQKVSKIDERTDERKVLLTRSEQAIVNMRARRRGQQKHNFILFIGKNRAQPVFLFDSLSFSSDYERRQLFGTKIVEPYNWSVGFRQGKERAVNPCMCIFICVIYQFDSFIAQP